MAKQGQIKKRMAKRSNPKKEIVSLVDFLICQNFSDKECMRMVINAKESIANFRTALGAEQAAVPLCLSCLYIDTEGNIHVDDETALSQERIKDIQFCRENGISSPETPPEIQMTKSATHRDADLFLLGVVLYLSLSRVEEKRYPFDWSLRGMNYLDHVRNDLDNSITALNRQDISPQTIHTLRTLLSHDLSIRGSAFSGI